MINISRLVTLLVLGLAVGACDRRPVYHPAEWVKVEAGSFLMGSPGTEYCREPGRFKETQHKVTLTHAFEIPVTEVTQGQYEDVMGYNPSGYYNCGIDCPVDKVSWYDAAEFCNAISRGAGLPECFSCSRASGKLVCKVSAAYRGKSYYNCKGYRLPTEAEWEYACRAGNTAALYNGGELASCNYADANANKIAWYASNSGKTLHLSGAKAANAWGIKDMSGSVWEWVYDFYQADLGSAAVTDPTGPATGDIGRMTRGGSVEVSAKFIRSASRWNYTQPWDRFKLHGFRCVRSR